MRNFQNALIALALAVMIGFLAASYANWYNARDAYFEAIEECQDKVREEHRSQGFRGHMDARELWDYCDSQIKG